MGLNLAKLGSMPGIFTEQLIDAARSLGFSQVGISAANPAKRIGAYFRWIDSGHHGEMLYLARPDRLIRRRDLEQILQGVRSIVSLSFNYTTISLPEEVIHDPSRGRISNYAWGIDYHQVLGKRMERLVEWLDERGGRGTKSKAYVDTGAILERDHGETAGLGFTGKNTMLISPRSGSYFFLGQILTTAELEPTPSLQAMPNCGTCQRCIDICPTNAFPEPYLLDARRCISYLTIELKGWIPRRLRPQMGNWIYGCDLCQEVCPFNRFSIKSDEPGFYPKVLDAAAPLLLDVLRISEAEFARRYALSPIKRIERRGLLRNACVAAGNWADESAVSVLVNLMEDPDSLIRGHAAWALGHIGGRRAVNSLNKAYSDEADGAVRQEIEFALIQP